MNISVLYYDNYVIKAEEVKKMYENMKAVLEEETRLLVIPKHYDLLLDCSTDQLLSIRSVIDTAIALKIQMESESTASSTTKYPI